VLNGLCADEEMRVSPIKLVQSDTSHDKEWRQANQWAKLVATVNFLDVRLINFPILTVVSAALAYGDDRLLQSFKNAHYGDYREKLATLSPELIPIAESKQVRWEETLAQRRLQTQNAIVSLERSNLYTLLQGRSAEQQKGGNTVSIQSLIQ